MDLSPTLATPTSMKRILFVCTGNICRSPTAEGIARHMAARQGLSEGFEFDSAGTQAWHQGEAPDRRAQAAARKRGYQLSALRARPVCDEDFRRFDLILAMDRGHMTWLWRECPPALRDRLAMLMDFSVREPGADVPDPYYGDGDGFEHVLDMCEDAIGELLCRFA